MRMCMDKNTNEDYEVYISLWESKMLGDWGEVENGRNVEMASSANQ